MFNTTVRSALGSKLGLLGACVDECNMQCEEDPAQRLINQASSCPT